jgi:tRNA A37 threonylcarbamoyladenosine modification protein TsaB
MARTQGVGTMASTIAEKLEEKRERVAQANDWHNDRVYWARYCFDHELIDSTEYVRRLRKADIQWGKMIDAIYAE